MDEFSKKVEKQLKVLGSKFANYSEPERMVIAVVGTFLTLAVLIALIYLLNYII